MYKIQLVTILIIGIAIGSISADSLRDLQALRRKCNLSQNGRCGAPYGNTVCPKGQYCSKWNWCGAEREYSKTWQRKFSYGINCTVAEQTYSTCKISQNGRCGNSYGKTVCHKGQYCSDLNWCGAQAKYKNSQQRAFSNAVGCFDCNLAPENGDCGPSVGNKICSVGYCVDLTGNFQVKHKCFAHAAYQKWGVKDFNAGAHAAECEKAKNPTKPAVKKPTKPAVKKPTKPAVKKPSKQPVKKPTKPPVKKPTKPPVKKPTKPEQKKKAEFCGEEVDNEKKPKNKKLLKSLVQKGKKLVAKAKLTMGKKKANKLAKKVKAETKKVGKAIAQGKK